MTGLTPYLFFPGTAREALEYYREVFGGEVHIDTASEFDRADLTDAAVAHGTLTGPVALFAADADPGDERPLRVDGMVFALLGTADPATLERWFAQLAEGGEVVDPLQRRPWGAHDGRVVDRFGVPWLVGYET